ncbi:MAG: hypothetical protein PHT07_12690 [Paludibacter sp.]|nr:hypothetical protein [Paludibacter sp.]
MKKQLIALLVLFAATNFLSLSNASTPVENVKVYSVEEIIEMAPKLVGQTVQVKGLVQHICDKTGRKLFLATADGSKTFRFNAGDKIDVFNENALDSTVLAIGVIVEQKMTLEDLNKQEATLIAAEKVAKAKKTKVQEVADHCTSEAKANGENVTVTPLQRVQILKDKLNKQIQEGKNNYLSFYNADKCNEYHIIK